MRSISKIVCAIDLSPQSDLVADYAITMATALNAELVAIYVAPEFGEYMSVEIMPESVSKLTAEVHASAQETMTKFFDKTFSGVKAQMNVLTGYPSTEIVEFATKECADLIVMGTHGHQGLSRILFGSVAEGVVKNAPMPVMTIRPQAEAHTAACAEK